MCPDRRCGRRVTGCSSDGSWGDWKVIILPDQPRRSKETRILKLHLARKDNQNTFTGYGEGYVMVNAVRYERSLVVLPDRPVADWAVSGVDTLREEDLGSLAGLGVEIVLLGTGENLRFLHPRLLQLLERAHVGVEVMDTRAACRTYNILVAEGRKVAAALILEIRTTSIP